MANEPSTEPLRLHKLQELFERTSHALHDAAHETQTLLEKNHALERENERLHRLVETKQHEFGRYCQLMRCVKKLPEDKIEQLVTVENTASMRRTLAISASKETVDACRRLAWLRVAADRPSFTTGDPDVDKELAAFRGNRFGIAYALLYKRFWCDNE